MKTLSLAVIGLGTLCLILSVAEKLIKKNFFEVAPANYVNLGSAFFLLAVAVMCYGRFYDSSREQK